MNEQSRYLEQLEYQKSLNENLKVEKEKLQEMNRQNKVQNEEMASRIQQLQHCMNDLVLQLEDRE